MLDDKAKLRLPGADITKEREKKKESHLPAGHLAIWLEQPPQRIRSQAHSVFSSSRCPSTSRGFDPPAATSVLSTRSIYLFSPLLFSSFSFPFTTCLLCLGVEKDKRGHRLKTCLLAVSLCRRFYALARVLPPETTPLPNRHGPTSRVAWDGPVEAVWLQQTSTGCLECCRRMKDPSRSHLHRPDLRSGGCS